jgi:hypothetical protein
VVTFFIFLEKLGGKGGPRDYYVPVTLRSTLRNQRANRFESFCLERVSSAAWLRPWRSFLGSLLPSSRFSRSKSLLSRYWKMLLNTDSLWLAWLILAESVVYYTAGSFSTEIPIHTKPDDSSAHWVGHVLIASCDYWMLPCASDC